METIFDIVLIIIAIVLIVAIFSGLAYGLNKLLSLLLNDH